MSSFVPQGYHYHRGITTTGVSFSHKEQAPKCSCLPQGYHSHVKSKLLSVHVCGTQRSEKVKPFPSTIPFICFNEKTFSVNHRYLLRSNEKTISVNTGVIHKKRNKINPSEEITPLPSTRVVLRFNHNE